MKVNKMKGYIIGTIIGISIGATFFTYGGALDSFTGMTQTWFDAVKTKLNGDYHSGKMCTSDGSGQIQCITTIPEAGANAAILTKFCQSIGYAGYNANVGSEGCTLFTCGDSISAGGYTYTTKLGPDGKCWTSTNMKHGNMLANGGIMPSDTNTIEKWCYSNNTSNCNTNGGLYTRAESMGFPASCNTINCTQAEDTTKSVCGVLGVGWRLPTDAEQYNLENASKTIGQTCVSTRNNSFDCSGAGWSGNKLSGIVSHLPGFRDTAGNFYNLNSWGFWWAFSEFSATDSWYRYLDSSNASLNRKYSSKANGLSVICIKN